MDPVRFTLCKTKGIGLIMWITFLCHFPPLIEPTEVSLENAGLILKKEFEVPVETAYVFYFQFVLPSEKSSKINKIIGERYDYFCDGETEYKSIPANKREGLGLPIPLKALIYDESSNKLIIEKTFYSLCVSSVGKNDLIRRIGKVELTRGDYRVEIFNLNPQPSFKDIKASIFLVNSGNGK